MDLASEKRESGYQNFSEFLIVEHKVLVLIAKIGNEFDGFLPQFGPVEEVNGRSKERFLSIRSLSVVTFLFFSLLGGELTLRLRLV